MSHYLPKHFGIMIIIKNHVISESEHGSSANDLPTVREEVNNKARVQPGAKSLLGFGGAGWWLEGVGRGIIWHL